MLQENADGTFSIIDPATGARTTFEELFAESASC